MAVSELTAQIPWNTPRRTAHRLEGWKLNSTLGCLSEISCHYFWGRCQLTKCSRPRATKSHYLLSSKLESDNGSPFQRAETFQYKSILKRGRQGRSVHRLNQAAKTFSARKGSVAYEDSQEDVTEEEEKFHRATSRGSAYWSDLMQTINGSENASLSALPHSAGTEPSERLRKPELAGAAQNHPGSAARKEEKQTKKCGGNNSGGAHKAGTLDTEMKLPLKQLLQFERKGEICHQTIFCMWTLPPPVRSFNARPGRQSPIIC
jgi:hypothetical protein